MAAGNKPIVVVGSINIDLVSTTARLPKEGETIEGTGFQIHPGGKGANQAVAAARLGYPVAMIGRLGDDTFGNDLRANLEREGVDASAVATTPGSSGVANILVAANGENCIVITAGANALVTTADIDANIDLIRSAGIVLTQLEIPIATVEHLAEVCKREGVPLVLDPAPAATLSPALLSSVEWFTPNETEAAFFVEHNGTTEPNETAQTLLNKNIRNVVLKMGPRGVFLASTDGLRDQVPSFPVQAVDTTAAGDAFNGAFATAMMLGKSARDSALFAAAAAALSVTRAGAQPSMPSRSEVEELLARSTSSN
ncbi:ribokinase [Silvibacterium acidisoli]|uniref:ribokinase n=1 Tax=Acidobacteriaceae bacterium ZG23-2 TaxID=2883246 RepID=UPI00406C61BC